MVEIAELCSPLPALSLQALLADEHDGYSEIFPSIEFERKGSEIIEHSQYLSKGYFWSPKRLQPVNLYKVTDVVCTESGYFGVHASPLQGANLAPMHVFEENQRNFPRGVHTDSTIPIAFAWLHANFTTYGHFLLEMAPKLLLFNMVRSLHPQIKIVIPKKAPFFIRRWVEFFSHLRDSDIVEFSGAIKIEHCILSDMLITFYLCGPMMNLFIGECIKKSACSSPTPHQNGAGYLWVSRSVRRQVRADFRFLQNSADLEQKLITRGFKVIAPEERPLAEQVRLFSEANVIVGELSSALHNAIFSRPDTLVVQLNPFNAVQRNIALSRGHRLISLLPDDGRLRSWPLRTGDDGAFFVDPTRVLNALPPVTDS